MILGRSNSYSERLEIGRATANRTTRSQSYVAAISIENGVCPSGALTGRKKLIGDTYFHRTQILATNIYVFW